MTSRHALSLWFLVIAALGVLQFFAKAYRGGQGFDPDGIAWTWLAGALLVAAAAIVSALRERRR